MAENEPVWFRIASRYPGLKVGLTVPFLLGATRNPPGLPTESRGAGQRQLISLLASMRDETPTGSGVNIQWCASTEAYVVAIIPGSSLAWEAADFDVPDIERLAAKLWDLYGDFITQGRFSKRGKWQPFTSEELANIRAILGSV